MSFESRFRTRIESFRLTDTSSLMANEWLVTRLTFVGVSHFKWWCKMPRVLVVDDSPVDRRLAGRLIEKFGDMEVFYAEDGQAALEQVEAHLPDLVVTDMQMPRLDGFALVEALKAQYPLDPGDLDDGGRQRGGRGQGIASRRGQRCAESRLGRLESTGAGDVANAAV
jgi:CheY-like chemotaxis protein